jgi:hypothetical protein
MLLYIRRGFYECRAHAAVGALFGCVPQVPWLSQLLSSTWSLNTHVIRSFRSFPFFRPPKAILVPGMYFLGFSRYSNCGG